MNKNALDPLTILRPVLFTELKAARYLAWVRSSEGSVSLLLKLLVRVEVDTQL